MGKEIIKWMPTNQKMPKKGSNTLATIRIEDTWFEQKNNSKKDCVVNTYIAHAYFNEKGVWELENEYDSYRAIFGNGCEPWEEDCDMALVDKEKFIPFGNRYYELRENKKFIYRRFIDIVAWIYAPVHPYGVSWDYLKQEVDYLPHAEECGLKEWFEQLVTYIGVENAKFKQEVEEKLAEIKENQKNGFYDDPYPNIGDVIDEMEYWLDLYEYIANNTIEEGVA